MPLESPSPATLRFITQVQRAYVSLMQSAAARSEESLGGTLFYAGELDEPGRILAVAGNIAGAASLAASADAAVLRQAMHDGVIDFLVTSLDEALRILKNEIRKRQPVAVAVSVAPQAIVKEMIERGVLPNLLPQLQPFSAPPEFAAFMAQGAERVTAQPLPPGRKFLIWPIPAEFAQRPAEFDALLLEHLPPGDLATRRWLRLSPRYLGPQARRLRSLACDEETASKLIDVLGLPLQP
ncbi:MAG TPA: hypothetical protein VGT08_18040 [Terracidiphilus sp.]|nr:hypothetical protein [Terracidiphilus sp.]